MIAPGLLRVVGGEHELTQVRITGVPRRGRIVVSVADVDGSGRRGPAVRPSERTGTANAAGHRERRMRAGGRASTLT